MTAGPDPSREPSTEPLHIAPPSPQPPSGGAPPDHSLAPPAIAATPGDACPTCGAHMAEDQRYCLTCGHRRGDPRLPFMDAVVFMDAVKRPQGGGDTPPPPPEKKSGLTPGTTLVAGVATLVLAIGVGVLIGQAGNSDSTPVANTAPQIIKVGGGSGESEETEASTGSKSGKQEAKSGGKSKTGGKKEKSNEAPELETGANGASKAAEEVLKPSGDVKLPPPTTEVGGKCDKGTAGCSESGEFNGSFFGE